LEPLLLKKYSTDTEPLAVASGNSPGNPVATATGSVSFVAKLSQPSSDGFPEGLLDQPFYGWVSGRRDDEPVSTGLITAYPSEV
jgi:hypothetical protein